VVEPKDPTQLNRVPPRVVTLECSSTSTPVLALVLVIGLEKKMALLFSSSFMNSVVLISTKLDVVVSKRQVVQIEREFCEWKEACSQFVSSILVATLAPRDIIVYALFWYF